MMTRSECPDCGMHQMDGHPIPHCYGCAKEAYDAAFATLRAGRSDCHYLGYDAYCDVIYVWGNGVTLGIEGRFDRYMRLSKTDGLVRRITDLEAENKDLLVENARLRRRLEGKPSVPIGEPK